MRIVMFYHSLISDWNHGNAHFLRGVVRELQMLGHEVSVYEPKDNWSLCNLKSDQGDEVIDDFKLHFPRLKSKFYNPATLDLDKAIGDADLVLVHEWNDHALVARINAHRVNHRYRLLFHDTHHRVITAESEMANYRLSNFDGVLAFGRSIAQLYLDKGWAQKAWVWHEAADTELFRPMSWNRKQKDIVWIGNWGDEERTEELHEYLLQPVKRLKLKGHVYGVRYPREGLKAVGQSGLRYKGWLPNAKVPATFAKFKVTAHIPRRPYREQLHGVPTIRVFESLACGIPLVSVHWNDVEQLFTPGSDYLVARNGREMTKHLYGVLNDEALAAELAEHGIRTIRKKHTCAHRVAELMNIARALGVKDDGIRKLQPLPSLRKSSTPANIMLDTPITNSKVR